METIFTIMVDLITTPITKYVVSPIKRHLSYAFKCDSQIQDLGEAVVQLKNKKDRLENSVDKATKNGEEIYENVTRWLTIVMNDVDEAEQLIQGKDEAKKKCCVGVCPNLKTRYQLSKKADKKASVICKLVQDAEGLDPISFRPTLEQIVEPSVYSREALASRVLILEQIMDALKDPNLNMIGVFGMGGVGKTTLSKEVQAKAMQEKMFETVVLVAVSQTPELKRIQTEIADFLGLKFDVEEVPGRASQLFKRLSKSKVLIILDDLWHGLDLYAIGIPTGKGCKLLLTSRRMDILRTEMRTQKDFSLGVLGEKEAWTLFQTIAEKSVDPQFHAIATEIAKKCAGLPLLIIIVAKELQNKELYAWVDMLNQLSVFGNDDIHERVNKVLQSSYENLPGEEVKSLFLLCSFFAQSNIQMQCLLIYSVGLGLFNRTYTIQQARNRLLTLIDKLKAECLLLDGDKDGFLKMHDVVRDAAISIASRMQHAFVGAGQIQLRDCLHQKCTKISLPYCNVRELPCGLECPEADLFLLFTEDLCLEIPDSFFEGIRKLKVADFTGMRLVSLPSSFASLTNLHALSLRKCRLNNVAGIGELKQLELLSFADSKIVELPREIEELTQLKLLDLRNCAMLTVIPANVLSKLCLLEELYVLNSFYRWDTKGNVSLTELENLSHLSTLEIRIVNPKLIPEGFRLFDGSQLHSFKISIGHEWGWQGKYESSKTLKLKLKSGIQLEHGIEVLLRGAEDLYLNEVNGINLDGEGFPKLKHLHIQNDSGNIQHLITSKVRASCQEFAILESLYLNNMKSLEKICDGQLATGSFGKLQKLNVHNCRKLKVLLSFSSAKCLSQLQEMELDHCNKMVAVFGDAIGDGNYTNESIEFTQMKSLKLRYLSGLRCFCRKEEGTTQMKLLFNEMVAFPNLTSLELYKCYSLDYIFTTSMVKCLEQLKKLEIEDCHFVEVIMLMEKFEEIEEESVDKIVFPKLDNLKLSCLPNLKRLCCGHLIEFPSLKTLSVEHCNAMENFVSKFPSNSNDGSDGYFFNEMVAMSNLERMELREMHNLRYLWDEKFIVDDSFSKLKSLTILRCSKLQIIFHSSIYRRFQGLERLDISFCSGVEEIYGYEGVDFDDENIVQTFSLRHLKILGLKSLKHIWSKDSCSASTFGSLQSVDVSWCENLKYVFPESIACDLLQLQRLDIRNCGVEVIIAKRSIGGPSTFEYPELTFLRLVDLNEMRSFYQGPCTLELPKLKRLDILGCHEILKFGSKTSYHSGDLKGKDNIPNPQSLSFVEKLIPNLEKLKIDNSGFQAIHQSGLFPADLFSKLKEVTVKFVEEESVPFLFGFRKRLYSLEKLVLSHGSLEEISLLDDDIAAGDDEHYPRLKHLELKLLYKLKHTMKKNSLLNYLSQYLQTLTVRYCGGLMDIALPSTSFQNLTTLCLHECHNMTKLITSSTAKTMVQLVQMKVQYCQKMEEIIANDTDCTEHDMINFKKLKCLELILLDRISSFCSGNYTINFPLLDQVIVLHCSKMKSFCGGVLSTPKLRGILLNDEQQWEGDLNTTIASHLREWVGGHFGEGSLFQNIKSLEVVKDAVSSKAILANQLQFLNRLEKVIIRDCDLVHAAFDLEGLSIEDGDAGFLPKLKELHLFNLPMLTRLCNKPPLGVLDFNKLRELKIENCGKLVNVFNWSMASCLVQLQRIELKNCELMERIIKEEVDDVPKVIILASLHYVVLECLPKYSGFYSGNGDLECPSLENISIRECPNIKAFISRLPMDNKKGKKAHDIHSSHKEFPSLKALSVDIKSMVAILQIELPSNFFMNVKILALRYFSMISKRSYVPLLHFLSRLPNLDKLEINESSFLKELFKFEGVNSMEEAMSLPQIKSLELQNLADVKHMWCHNSQYHASLFQCLETLEVRECKNLIDLASSSTSFQNLTTLRVFNCNRLIYLMTSSVARSMVQLEKLSIKSCELVMEIVGDGNDGTFDDIEFTKMKSLELSDLHSLQSFSSGHCAFKFPCLENVFLTRCPNMKLFCAGTINASVLRDVKHGDYRDRRCYWKGDINATIQQLYTEMVGFKGLFDIQLTMFPTLKGKWGDQIPFKYFEYGLKKLVVDDCASLSNAISPNMIRRLNNLEELKVEKCELVEQVFDLEGLDASGGGINGMKALKQLQLIDLPSLRLVWSKDPQHILSFRNLRLLKVQNCGNLTYIFDLSMALRLPKLEHVEVKNCRSVKHIIVENEEETMQEYQILFPSLLSTSLQHLANLSSFYSTTGFLEFPSLKFIEVVECPKMEVFPSTFLNGEDSGLDVEKTISCKDPNSQPAFLGNQIAIPGLEELKVEWNSLNHIFSDNDQPEFLSRLKLIELIGYQGEYGVLPPNFLQIFPKLKKLSFCDALFEEINVPEMRSLEGKDPKSHGSLTKLKLSKLPKLKHLVSDDFSEAIVFQNLEGLELVECSRLKILVPSSASFQNLTSLQVSKCDALVNLMTITTARSLVQLKTMIVKECKMMQEVIAVGSDGVDYEILFSQLECLELDDLQCLESFCSADYELEFPCLEEVVVIRCPIMKKFASSETPKLKKVKTGRREYEWEWEGSLNNTIQALHAEKDADETDAGNFTKSIE